MQQASYLEGGPLLWILPLYLHVNKKSDDDEDDDDDDDDDLFCLYVGMYFLLEINMFKLRWFLAAFYFCVGLSVVFCVQLSGVKRWPADLAVPSSSPARGETISTANGVPLHTAFHYQPLIILI